MMRVLVIVNNLKQASYRVRIEAMLEPMRARGIDWDVQVRPRKWLDRRRLMASASRYDGVILQRKLLDPGDARRLRRSARWIIFDVDDAVMLPQEQGEERWLTRWRRERRFSATADIIDLAVVGNAHLGQIMAEQGCTTECIPTVVDPAHYHMKHHTPKNGLTLVWIGSASTIPYLQACLPALESAADAVPGLRLVTIADVSVSSTRLQVEHVPWSVEAEADALHQGDVGIAPTPDDPWSRGKCGFKIIQYMASGLPVIASPVGANTDIVSATGYLPTDSAGWCSAIVELAADAARRNRLGEAGRARVAQFYSVDYAVQRWEAILQAVSCR